MEQPNERKKIPAEAVELYSHFIHGQISRRAFVDGVKRFAVAGLTAGAIIEALMPNYALGQQVRKDDERIKVSYETVPSPNGYGYSRLFRPPFALTPAPRPERSCRAFLSSTRIAASIRHTETSHGALRWRTSMPSPDCLTSMGGYRSTIQGGQLFGKLEAPKRTRICSPRRGG